MAQKNSTKATTKTSDIKASGTYSIFRVLKGFIFCGPSTVSFHDTPEQARAELLRAAKAGGISTRDQFTFVKWVAAQVYDSFRGWMRTNQESYDAWQKELIINYSMIAVDGAYLVDYGKGLLIAKSLDELGVTFDTWVVDKLENNTETQTVNGSAITPEEIARLFSLASSSVPPVPDVESPRDASGGQGSPKI